MKRFLLLLFAFSLSFFAEAVNKENLFPVIVEFEDGTVRKMYSDGCLSAPRLPNRIKFVSDLETMETESYNADLLKNVYYSNEDGKCKLSYLFLHEPAYMSNCKAAKNVWKHKHSVYSVYEGKNISVYVNRFTSMTINVTLVYFKRKDENAKFVLRAQKEFGIYTILPLKKALLNYFTEEDFVKRIKAGEFDLEHRSDWSIGYMVEIAKAYDENRIPSK